MSLANTLNRLSKTTAGIVQKQGTDAIFVLRAEKTPGKGYTTKDYQPTTAQALPCFYSEHIPEGEELETIIAAQRKPSIFRRISLAPDTDVRASDRLRLVARGHVGQIEMEVIRVFPLLGLFKVVIAVEEVNQ